MEVGILNNKFVKQVAFIRLNFNYLIIVYFFLFDGWAFSYITEMELLSKKGITKHEDIIRVLSYG
jgi:hypothetical protein